jgi:hypothetical protein
VYAGYRWTEPKKWYNRIFLNFNASISNLFTQIKSIETKYQRSEINFNGNIQTKKLSWLGLYTAYNPHQNDFYEPRLEGKYFRRGSSVIFDTWYESNSSKKYSFYTEDAIRIYSKFYKAVAMDWQLSQTYRFNSKFSLSHRLNYYPRINSIGYAWTNGIDSVVMGRRKINTVENILSAKYNFTNKMGITFRARHYVSAVKNKEFFTLRNDGNLDPNSVFNKNVDRNLNFFNIDMVYTWQFAPGSSFIVTYKNLVLSDTQDDIPRYIENLKNTFKEPQTNSISLKILYYLDYEYLKRK